MKKLFIDIETTGVNPYKHGIIQLAAIAEVNGTIEEYSSPMSIMHGDEIDERALEVTGTTREQIENAASALIVRQSFLKFMEKYIDKFNRTDKFTFIGYNCQAFDYVFMRRWFEKCGDKYFGSWFWWPTVDVAILAMSKCTNRAEYPDFKLHTVCQMNGLEWDEEQAYDALYDIRKTKELYDVLTRHV